MRGDLARAIVEAGWDLNELRPAAMSLETIFLQLTGSEATPAPDAESSSGPPPETPPPADAPAPEATA